MDIAIFAGLGLALVSVLVVLWDAFDDAKSDDVAADTLKSLRG